VSNKFISGRSGLLQIGSGADPRARLCLISGKLESLEI